MNRTILLIEDNVNILRLNRSVLSARGYRVLESETIADGRALMESETPGLIVLDINLPDGNGLDFCEELRGKSNIPVLLLTALKEDENIIDGLKRGGDDYMSKPYNMEVFAARVEALLRRAEQYADTLTRGALTLNIPKHQAFINGADAGLTPMQFSVLHHFMRHEGQIIGAQRLYAAVWGQPMADDDNAVKTVVSRLREKIKPAGFGIENVRGGGYRFEEIR